MTQNIAKSFFEYTANLLHTVMTESGESIQSAAHTIADAIAADKDFLLFGSGHSGLVAHESAGRAGGLAPALVIQDVMDGDAERLEGMAAIMLGRYDLRAGSVLVVISHSGLNAVPVEVALLGKSAGLTIIAITSLSHSQAVPPRHSSGKRLFEVADIVIDTHGVRGDSVLDIPGTTFKSGATSTIVGCAIIEALTVQVATILSERGVPPPIIVSSNIPGGDEHNIALMAKYRPRLSHSQVPSLLAPAVGKPISSS